MMIMMILVDFYFFTKKNIDFNQKIFWSIKYMIILIKNFYSMNFVTPPLSLTGSEIHVSKSFFCETRRKLFVSNQVCFISLSFIHSIGFNLNMMDSHSIHTFIYNVFVSRFKTKSWKWKFFFVSGTYHSEIVVCFPDETDWTRKNFSKKEESDSINIFFSMETIFLHSIDYLYSGNLNYFWSDKNFV